MAMIDTIEDAEATGTWRVRPGHAHAVEVPAGHLLRITDLFGKQMAACVAFNRDDRAEYLSVAATRGTHGTLALGAGTTLLSNRRTPIFDLVEDSVGRHDALIPACDPPRYAQIGEPGHPNCRQALTAALAPYGIADDRLPDPVNWFMHVAIGPDGDLEIREPLSTAGDHVLLRARLPAIVAVAACPHDKNPTNGFAPSDILVQRSR